MKASVDKAFNVGMVLFSLCAGGAFGVWRELGSHGDKLAALSEAKLIERVTAIENNRFTAADGAKLTQDVNSFGNAIRTDLSTMREALAAMRARPENGVAR